MSGFTSLPRLARAVLVGLGLTCLAAVPIDARAESPAPAETSQQQTASNAGDDSRAYWWFYLSLVGLAVTLPLGLVLYRRFRVADREGGGRGGGPELEPDPAGESAGGLAQQGDGGLERAEKVFFTTDEWQESESSARQALGQEGTARMCPDCGKQFPATVMVCPDDSTPLHKIERAERSRAGDETVLERQRCPGCGRRYEPGPAYCYHDGMRLRHDTAEEADDAPVFKACEACGWEGKLEERTCPRDGQELTAVDPSDETRLTPPVPVLCCPECGEYADPGQARCPEDDAVLTPLANAHATELPARGFGPRRKICQECGQTFSAAGRYCTKDGSELVPMN